MTADATALHDEVILIDAVCPLLDDPAKIADYQQGGVSIIAPTVATTEDAGATLRTIGRWHRLVRSRSDLMLVTSAAQARQAKREGKTGVILHFQGAAPLEDSLDLIDAFKALGVGIIQLTYNRRNRLGDGCEEPGNAGLSRFGIEAIKRMNEARVIVDCSHTGVQTTLDAIEHSIAPVIISHANAKAVYPSARNISDDLIKVVAGNGGTIGVVGFPGFVSADARPTMDQFIDHIAHIAALVGVEHVTLGIDYYSGQYPYANQEKAQVDYDHFVEVGMWDPDVYPPPPHFYPAGMETPAGMRALTERLIERGFSASDIRAVYGENLLRIYETIWGA
jgi:membrane dipeptidase